MQIKIVPKGERYIMAHLGIGPIYAEKNGHLVLKHEISWKKLSGFWINTPKGCMWIKFRRTGGF